MLCEKMHYNNLLLTVMLLLAMKKCRSVLCDRRSSADNGNLGG